jgi:hypothetical protein
MKQQFIAGIYNYCDRWCERCTFTTRCRNFESTSKPSSEELDINNEAFWNNISFNFTKAIEMLHEAAKKHGIEMKPMTQDEEQAYEKKEAFIKTSVNNHALSKLCRLYQKTAMPFLKKSEGMVDKTRELVSGLRMGIKTEEEVTYTIADMGDCFEILQWYLFFIDAKLQRALHGKIEDDEDDDIQTDSNGSAKIALIAIERSMNALMKLYELTPANEDILLHLLSLLSQLKQTALIEFPNAMQFKRPGFDD